MMYRLATKHNEKTSRRQFGMKADAAGACDVNKVSVTSALE